MRVICECTRDVSRAVPTGFRLGGGVFQNFDPLPFQGPPKKAPRKAKIFPENVGDGGGRGGRSTLFFRKQKFPKSFAKQLFSRNFQNFQRRNPSFLKILQFRDARAPSPQVGPPFFTFLGGVLHPPPPHPPGGTALDVSLLSQMPRGVRVSIT